LMGVGCDLNGAHYENGEAFEPSALYKCTCIAGAIGCTPAFLQKPAGLLDSTPMIRKLPPTTNKNTKKHTQDTTHISGFRDPLLAWKNNCLIQTTFWSPCSKSCGLGISERINNDNDKCEMRKDTRLCLLRPCEKKRINGIQVSKGKSCQLQFQAKKREKLVLSGCTSTKKFKPTFCGICTNKRCCSPKKTIMITVNFNCPGGLKKTWKMQWIISCICEKKCNDSGDMFSDLSLM
ncbi:cellular communication network factor 6, partial [Stigmatopora nigra]